MEDKEITNVKQNIAESQAVIEMCQSDGWKIIEKHFQSVKQVLIKALLTVKDPAEIVRLQERFRAFDEMLLTVTGISKEIEYHVSKLQELREEQQFQDNYGLSA